MLQSPNPAGVSEELPIPNRDEAAAPPLYLLFVLLVPIGGAFYIALSRYMDYAHHGFDILSGSLIGIVSAYFSFRWYHPPLARGSGWAWGPRSPGRAFEVGVGVDGYVEERTKEMYANGQDIELGRVREE
jgi:PAP2 superfamily